MINIQQRNYCAQRNYRHRLETDTDQFCAADLTINSHVSHDVKLGRQPR